MDPRVVAIQNYNGGIIFVSYLISVIGAQTTLELLTRRTHIHGWYNWFLLTAAAFIMGAVSIWSMHFIGNNSLTLTYEDRSYQLDYKAGYTFASLVVSIACMFISFCFIGVTEKAYLYRIIPSGLFTGLGIVCMHYIGQFAINYFIIVYKTGFLVGAVVIACVAITTALYLFFKLREIWMNTWYKRLGCAMLMALAVCGMHYTALVGTIFYIPSLHGSPPKPSLSTGALIGIIVAIVVAACFILISVRLNTEFFVRKEVDRKKLILNCLFFDSSGRILVRIDGSLPKKEIFSDLDSNELTKGFEINHPLFTRLFENTLQTPITPLFTSDTSQTESVFSNIEHNFSESIDELQQELGFAETMDMGILSDIIITAGAKKPQKNPLLFLQKKKKPINVEHNDSTEEFPQISTKEKRLSRISLWPKKATAKSSKAKKDVVETMPIDDVDYDDVLVIVDEESMGELSDGQDTHIFLTRQLSDEHDVKRLMSLGYRFAHANFISKTMGERLRVSTEVMYDYFTDIHHLTQQEISLLVQQEHENPLLTMVCMGVFVLGEKNSVLVDNRYRIPLVEVNYSTGLNISELEFINTTLQGCTLQNLSHITRNCNNSELSRALDQAARQLKINASLSSAALNSTILDIPAFSLTTRPCQLILFSSFSTKPSLEGFKYLPLAIYKPLCVYLTDRASFCYKRQKTRPYSMQQQQIYQQAGLSDSVLSEEDIFSLPPPPRTRRKRISNTSHILSDLPSSSPLTILPSKDRFWWIDIIVENIIHNSM